MKTLSMSERHEIYLILLNRFQHAKDHNTVLFGICGFLLHFLHVDNRTSFEIDISANFPEFFSLRPANISFGDYWWPTSDMYSRIAALKKCVERTRPSFFKRIKTRFFIILLLSLFFTSCISSYHCHTYDQNYRVKMRKFK